MPSSALSMPATASTSSTACARVRHGFYQGLCPICGASSTYRRCPFAIGPLGAYYTHLRNDAFPIAGWSSLVARWAHNPEVVGSNPAPATKNFKLGGQTASEFFCYALADWFTAGFTAHVFCRRFLGNKSGDEPVGERIGQLEDDFAGQLTGEGRPSRARYQPFALCILVRQKTPLRLPARRAPT